MRLCLAYPSHLSLDENEIPKLILKHITKETILGKIDSLAKDVSWQKTMNPWHETDSLKLSDAVNMNDKPDPLISFIVESLYQLEDNLKSLKNVLDLQTIMVSKRSAPHQEEEEQVQIKSLKLNETIQVKSVSEDVTKDSTTFSAFMQANSTFVLPQ